MLPKSHSAAFLMPRTSLGDHFGFLLDLLKELEGPWQFHLVEREHKAAVWQTREGVAKLVLCRTRLR